MEWGAVVVIALVAFWLGQSRGEAKEHADQERRRCTKCQPIHEAKHVLTENGWRERA